MLERADIERLIPQKGSMCLLDRVVHWNERRIEASSGTHRDATNPLRTVNGLRALSLCEYGAQAMAVHGALLQSLQQRTPDPMPGMVATLRQVRIHRVYVHALAGDLIVSAERVHAIEELIQYEFRAAHEGIVVVEGRATIVLRLAAR